MLWGEILTQLVGLWVVYTPKSVILHTKNDGFGKCISFEIWQVVDIYVKFFGAGGTPPNK